MTKAVIVDYQLGNLFSVNQALLNIGLDVKISSDEKDIKQADAIVLPGVGAFGDAMDNLQTSGLIEPLLDFVKSGKPFLGICLGLQLLFTESEEFGSSKGLNLIPGKVKRFSNVDNEGETIKVPQIAWNTIIEQNSWKKTPLKTAKNGEFMYFVHSFFVEPENKKEILSKTQYHNQVYASSVLKDNIFACQFHPEKSAAKGLEIYYNWAADNRLI